MSTVKTEDLIKALENDNAVESQDSSPIDQFISHYNLTPGPSGVKIHLLQILYNQLSKTHIKLEALKKLLLFHFKVCKDGFVYVNMDVVKATDRAKQILNPPRQLASSLNNKRHKEQYSQFIADNNLLGDEIWIKLTDLHTIYLAWRLEKRHVTLIKINHFKQYVQKDFETKEDYIKINNVITKERLSHAKEEIKKKRNRIPKSRSEP